MNKKALTFAILLILIGVVFAVAPSITIIQPTGGEILHTDYNIIFNVNNFNSLTSISITDVLNAPDTNFVDSNGIICLNSDTNFFNCNYYWSTLWIDGNYKIEISVQGIKSENSLSGIKTIETNYFLIDNTPPTISYNFPDNDSWINPQKVLFSFDLIDATSGVDKNSIVFNVKGTEYSFDSGKISFSSNVADFNAKGIDFNNGEKYNLVIDVNDFAKNHSTKDLNFWVDMNDPIAVDFNVIQRTNKQKTDFNILATDQTSFSGLDKMYFSCDSTNWKSANYGTIYSDFNIIDSNYGCNALDGNKTIYFKVKDKAGNFSNILDKNIYYDINAPLTILTRSDNNLWTDSPVTIDINC